MSAVFKMNEFATTRFLNEEYQCRGCSSFGTCDGTRMMCESNHVLIINLGRVKFNTSGKKIRTRVKLATIEDFGEFMTTEAKAKGSQYSLIGVVCHHGTQPIAGHYTSVVRCPDGQWRVFDDDHQPRLVNERSALRTGGDNAKILFYVRDGSDFAHPLMQDTADHDDDDDDDDDDVHDDDDDDDDDDVHDDDHDDNHDDNHDDDDGGGKIEPGVAACVQHLVHLATAGHMLETGDMDDNVALYVEATASPVRRPAIRLSREHMQCLLPNSMLNDEVINMYSSLLHQESLQNEPGGSALHIMSTHFYSRMCEYGKELDFAGVKRWTKRVDVFRKDEENDEVTFLKGIILVPIHAPQHWVLVAIDFRAKQLKFFDSLGGSSSPYLDNIERWLQLLSEEQCCTVSLEDWERSSINCPLQDNGIDCGVFVCQFMKHVARDGARFSFSQTDIPALRLQIAHEIFHAHLVDDCGDCQHGHDLIPWLRRVPRRDHHACGDDLVDDYDEDCDVQMYRRRDSQPGGPLSLQDDDDVEEAISIVNDTLTNEQRMEQNVQRHHLEVKHRIEDLATQERSDQLHQVTAFLQEKTGMTGSDMLDYLKNLAKDFSGSCGAMDKTESEMVLHKYNQYIRLQDDGVLNAHTTLEAAGFANAPVKDDDGWIKSHTMSPMSFISFTLEAGSAYKMSGNARYDVAAQHKAAPVSRGAPPSFGAVLRFENPNPELLHGDAKFKWEDGKNGPFHGEAGKANGVEVVQGLLSEEVQCDLHTLCQHIAARSQEGERLTRSCGAGARFEPQQPGPPSETVKECWYVTQAYQDAVKAKSKWWRRQEKNLTISTDNQVEDHDCLLALEKSVRAGFPELAGRELYCIQLVEQNAAERGWHVDKRVNTGDIICGVTVTNARVLGFRLTKPVPKHQRRATIVQPPKLSDQVTKHVSAQRQASLRKTYGAQATARLRMQRLSAKTLIGPANFKRGDLVSAPGEAKGSSHGHVGKQAPSRINCVVIKDMKAEHDGKNHYKLLSQHGMLDAALSRNLIQPIFCPVTKLLLTVCDLEPDDVAFGRLREAWFAFVSGHLGASLSAGSAQRRDDEHADGKAIKVQVREVMERLIKGVIVAEGKEKDLTILKYALSLFPFEY